jgi:RNA polymerase sigma factor FliA
MDEMSKLKLWEAYQTHMDPKLKEQIIIEYAQLVKYVAGRLSMYLGNNVEYDDLCGYGVFGLIDAIDKFSLEKGVKFETYASLRIRGAILDSIRKMDWIPRSIRKKQKSIEQAKRDLEDKLDRHPDDDEIAVELQISTDEYFKWLDQTKALNLTSLEEYVEQGGENQVRTLSQNRFSEPEEMVEKESMKKALTDAITDLSEKERKVIVLYYYEELTLKEISAIMEVSESRISQLHTKALKKMKEALGSDLDLFMNP